jgi:plasmid maintenance system antidote protein VapI
MNQEQPKDLITLSEAARVLGVSRPKMSRLVATGKLVTYSDPLDDRAKLVSKSAVLALRVQRAEAA